MTHHPVDPPPAGDAVPQILHIWMGAFRSQFTAPSWQHVLVLIMGCILAPGKRTVTACLRMTGRTSDPGFAKYHHVLNRARWNPRALAGIVLTLIVARLVPYGIHTSWLQSLR